MTAVEWLQEQFLKHEIEIKDFEKYLFIKASELFEQQIKDAYVSGFKECEKIHEEVFFIQDLSEQYYNETYKK